MKKFKGTKFPWEYSSTMVYQPINDGGIIVCMPTEFSPKGSADWKYNAKLIAAAPDLLAFAMDFVEKVESGRARSTDSYNKAKIAINKALDL